MWIKQQSVNCLHFFLWFFFVFFLIYCQPQVYYPQLPEDPESVVISGRILNYREGISKDSIAFCPSDFLSGYNDPQHFVIKPSGEFKINYRLVIPHDPFLYYYSNIPLLIYPGDSIHIELDARDTLRFNAGHVQYSGVWAQENEAVQSYFLNLSSIFSKEKIMTKMVSSIKREWNYGRMIRRSKPLLTA